jgi:hypothetical protein
MYTSSCIYDIIHDGIIYNVIYHTTYDVIYDVIHDDMYDITQNQSALYTMSQVAEAEAALKTKTF